jgi:hypothetical protein
MVETRSQARRRHRDETDEQDVAAVHVEGACAHDHAKGDESDCCSDLLDDIETSDDDDDDESDTGRVPSAKRAHLNPVPRHRALVHVAARVLVLSCALATVYLTARVAYRAWFV